MWGEGNIKNEGVEKREKGVRRGMMRVKMREQRERGKVRGDRERGGDEGRRGM